MKINFIQKFLMICSGANLHILKKTPSEWNKYSGIGGIVLFTGFFAGISAGYATYTIFDDFHAALAAGAGQIHRVLYQENGFLEKPASADSSAFGFGGVFGNCYFKAIGIKDF